MGGGTFSNLYEYFFKFFACVDNFFKYNPLHELIIFPIESLCTNFFFKLFGVQIFFFLFPLRDFYFGPPLSMYSIHMNFVFRARQLDSVVQLVRVLHQNHRATCLCQRAYSFCSLV